MCGRKHFADAVADTIFGVFLDADAFWEKQIFWQQYFYFLAAIILQNSSCILPFFAHTTLIKATSRVQSIFNIVTVVGSVDVVAYADSLVLQMRTLHCGCSRRHGLKIPGPAHLCSQRDHKTIITYKHFNFSCDFVNANNFVLLTWMIPTECIFRTSLPGFYPGPHWVSLVLRKLWKNLTNLGIWYKIAWIARNPGWKVNIADV